jgi:hypothetical protein
MENLLLKKASLSKENLEGKEGEGEMIKSKIKIKIFLQKLKKILALHIERFCALHNIVEKYIPWICHCDVFKLSW